MNQTDHPMAAKPVGPRKLDGYVRVSRVGDRGGESFISPDLQEERIRSYAEARGFSIGLVLHELDRSGTDLERPQLRLLMERIAGHQSGGLIVARLDRFARSALGALRTFREIEGAGGLFISVEDGFDTSTGFGQAMMTILLALAELEHARVRDCWKMSQRKAVARGVHAASRVPVGYRRGGSGRLVPDNETAAIIVEAFRQRSAGATYREIAKFFTERGLGSSAGSVNWTGRGVESVLKNRVYLGEARSGSYRNPDAHHALVPPRLWLAAQFGAELRASHPSAKTLLAGLVRCAGCCHVLGGSWMPLAGGRLGNVINGYRCRQHFKAGDCPEPAWVLAREIEALVVETFFARLRTRRRKEIDFATAETELRTIERKLGRLTASEHADSSGEAAEVASRVQSKHVELLALLRRDAFNALPTLPALRTRWPTMAVAEQRAALSLAFDAVVVERGKASDLERRVHFINAGELPDYFPLGGAISSITPYINTPRARQRAC